MAATRQRGREACADYLTPGLPHVEFSHNRPARQRGKEKLQPHIYHLRMVLRGISPLIWRRLLVRSDSTVAQLHHALQVAFGWEDEYLNPFETARP